MTSEYSYRIFEDADTQSVNSLYEEITGNRRTHEQFQWQWREAPGGKGEIWLIESDCGDGEKLLIGHHGVMPIRFSNGQQNLVFGKTENTMVLPEYRRKILYPRYERRFLSQYENRFDALFSTTGPSAAIRLRKALGYEFQTKYVRYKIRTNHSSECHYIVSRLEKLVNRRNRKVAQLPYGFDIDQWNVSGHPELNLRILDDESAAHDPFFENFWGSVRDGFCLTPRRDTDDLRWRFWNNPYKKHIVFVSDGASGEPGYVVLSRSEADPNCAVLEDIVPCRPRLESFDRLLFSVLCWLKKSPIKWLSYWTTDEMCPTESIGSGLVRQNMRFFAIEKKLRRSSEQFMPRRLTPVGRSHGIDATGWYITPIVTEGRVAH